MDIHQSISYSGKLWKLNKMSMDLRVIIHPPNEELLEISMFVLEKKQPICKLVIITNLLQMHLKFSNGKGMKYEETLS